MALYPYKPQKPDELELKKGGIYMVSEMLVKFIIFIIMYNNNFFVAVKMVGTKALRIVPRNVACSRGITLPQLGASQALLLPLYATLGCP